MPKDKQEAAKKPDTKGKESAQEKVKKEPKPVKALVTVNKGALSLDVGPAVVAGLAKSYGDEAKAQELMQGVLAKRYDLLANTTQAIVKAAMADTSIDLSASFSGDKGKNNILNDQIGLALGIREVIEETDLGGNVHKRLVYSKAVAKYFPQPKDVKDAPETVRKATLRSNFTHMVKKCAQAAAAIVEQGITVVKDKGTGTLQLTGPAIEKKFGQSSVLLDEKLTIGTGDAAIKLKEKPSFTAIAKMGAEAAGKTLETRKDSRVSSNAVDPETAIQSICNSLVQAVSKLTGPPSGKTKASLESVQSALSKVLNAK